MIQLTEEIAHQIRQEGELNYPDECCGILFGEIRENGDKKAEQLWKVTNSSVKEEKYHRFLITPETLLQAELQARQKKKDIVGFYHSHPDCPAVASKYDREHALPVYSYLIVSVKRGKAVEFRSFQIDSQDQEEFEEEKVLLYKI